MLALAALLNSALSSRQQNAATRTVAALATDSTVADAQPGVTTASRPRRPAATPEARALVEDLIVRNQRIFALDGSLAYAGDIDLAPTLARIEAGKRDRHPNDGSVFGNREGRLPRKPRGHYLEWVVRTPGLREVGPQRVVTGKDGEVYYTPDHYQSFIRIR